MRFTDLELDHLQLALVSLGGPKPSAQTASLVGRIKEEKKLREIATTHPRWRIIKDQLHIVGNGTLPENWRELAEAFAGENGIVKFNEAAAAAGVRVPKHRAVQITSVEALEALIGDFDFDTMDLG